MGVDVHLDEIKRLTPRYNVCIFSSLHMVLPLIRGHISVLSRLASSTARRQWLYLCHRCKRLSSPSPESSAKGDEDHPTDVDVCTLVCLFNTLVWCHCIAGEPPRACDAGLSGCRGGGQQQRGGEHEMLVDRDALVFRHFLLSLLNSCSMLLLGQCTTVAPEGHSASNLCALPSKGPTWHFFLSRLLTERNGFVFFFFFFF